MARATLAPEMSTTPEEGPTPKSGHALRRLRIGLRVLSSLRISDRNILFVWAALVGVVGALCALLVFRLNDLLFLIASGGESGSHVEAFTRLAPWQRLLIPTAGGLLGGIILMFAQRYVRTKATDYMEAIALGDGNIPVRASLIRTLCALVCYSSGESVGKEGPLVQLSTVCASFFGRLRRMAPARKRMLVACGAAAGLSAAYHTPLASAIFVAEIVLGSLAMESLGPLLIATVASTLTLTAIDGSPPLYTFTGTVVSSSWDYAMFPLLGLVVGAASLLWLHALRSSRQAFGSIPIPIWARLALGGFCVGLLAIWHPESVGNGAHMIQGLLDEHYPLKLLTLLLVLRVAATCAAFGSGALGGVFTPSLLVGGAVGSLFCLLASHFWPGGALVPAAFALAGMGGFLAASAQAPITAILMIFELTRRYDLILPLALTSIAAYTAARAIRSDNLYAESLSSGPRSVFDLPLAHIKVRDILRPTAILIRLESPFRDIAAAFLLDTSVQLWVVGRDGRLLGRILLSDVEPFLKEEALANTVIAGDLMQDEPLSLPSDVGLPRALEIFTENDCERLPVIEPGSRKLLGSVSRSDLFLLLAELSHREQTRS